MHFPSIHPNSLYSLILPHFPIPNRHATMYKIIPYIHAFFAYFHSVFTPKQAKARTQGHNSHTITNKLNIPLFASFHPYIRPCSPIQALPYVHQPRANTQQQINIKHYFKRKQPPYSYNLKVIQGYANKRLKTLIYALYVNLLFSSVCIWASC